MHQMTDLRVGGCDRRGAVPALANLSSDDSVNNSKDMQ